MDREELNDLALSVGLTAIAGCVDAIGFLNFGHLFVSFMSGDSTQFSVSVSQMIWQKSRSAGGVVVLFVIGVIVGRILGDWAQAWRRPVIFSTEACLLGLAILMPSMNAGIIVPIVVAMGIQNAAIHKAGKAKMSLTYVTGTLVSFGEKLADAFRTTKGNERWGWTPYLLLWIGFVTGAVVGALCYGTFQLKALWFPAGALIVLTLLSITSDVLRNKRLKRVNHPK